MTTFVKKIRVRLLFNVVFRLFVFEYQNARRQHVPVSQLSHLYTLANVKPFLFYLPKFDEKLHQLLTDIKIGNAFIAIVQ